MTADLPDDVVLVCEYELDVLVDCIDETAYFSRSGGTDELWLRNEFYAERPVSAPTAEEPAVAVRLLLELSIRGTWAALPRHQPPPLHRGGSEVVRVRLVQAKGWGGGAEGLSGRETARRHPMNRHFPDSVGGET